MQKVATINKQAGREETSFKDKVLYSLLAAAGLLGGGFLLKKGIDKLLSNQAHKNSFEDGTPETVAKQIYMAFENDGAPGTDVENLRATLRNVKNQTDLSKIFNAYKREYNENMYERMADELQTTEYNEMLQIVKGKPEKEGLPPTSVQFTAWAKRLKAAFDKSYWIASGTDEDAIKAVLLELPTQMAFINTAVQYKRDYGSDLMTDLRAELEVWEFPDYMKIITSKPRS